MLATLATLKDEKASVGGLRVVSSVGSSDR
jgi:hypothetical protein